MNKQDRIRSIMLKASVLHQEVEDAMRRGWHVPDIMLSQHTRMAVLMGRCREKLRRLQKEAKRKKKGRI